MADLNQVDLNVRLQLLGCKYSEIANTYANNLKYGMKCSRENLRKLLLLNALIDILECYDIIHDVGGVIEQNIATAGLQINNIVELFSNGVTITGPITLSSNNTTVQATQITTAINNYANTVFSAIVSSTDRKSIIVKLTTPCTNPTVTVTVNNGTPVVLEYLTEGECDVDNNCFTEDQIKELIDSIAKLIKQCFQPMGYDYEIPEGYTLNEETGELTKD